MMIIKLGGYTSRAQNTRHLDGCAGTFPSLFFCLKGWTFNRP